MSSQNLRNAPPDVNAQAPVQNVLNEQEGNYLISSHNKKTESCIRTSRKYLPYALPFFDGLEINETCRRTGGGHASLAASPIAALQAAWAGVLSTYTAVEDDVTYKASPAIHTPGHIQEEISYPIPTRACLGTPQGWGQVTNGSILKGLTESSALALPQHDESSKHGTMIALEGKERFEDGTNSGDRGFKGEELPVSLVAWPDIAGSLKLKLLFTKMALNKTSALVLLKQLDDALAFIFAHLSKVIARSLAATRPSLLPISNEMPEKCTDSGSQPAYLHSHFENTARDSPHRIALDFRQDLDSERSGDGTMWTYEQRNRYASHPPLWPIG